MKSKSILQMKPELMIIGLFMLLLLSGTAAADIEAPMISTDEIMEYLHAEASSLFLSLILVMVVLAAIAFIIGSSSSKAWGYRVVGCIVIALFVYYVLPWLISDVENISTVGDNSTS